MERTFLDGAQIPNTQVRENRNEDMIGQVINMNTWDGGISDVFTLLLFLIALITSSSCCRCRRRASLKSSPRRRLSTKRRSSSTTTRILPPRLCITRISLEIINQKTIIAYPESTLGTSRVETSPRVRFVTKPECRFAHVRFRLSFAPNRHLVERAELGEEILESALVNRVRNVVDKQFTGICCRRCCRRLFLNHRRPFVDAISADIATFIIAWFFLHLNGKIQQLNYAYEYYLWFVKFSLLLLLLLLFYYY